MSTGTTRRTTSSLEASEMWSVGFQLRSNAVGIGPPAVMSGIHPTRASVRICPTPMVAMSNTRRGDSKSLRTTMSSMAIPMTAVAATATKNASHQLTP